ncbi:NYN domain-containing protein [Sporosarcina pasteurii]|uniref:Predicted RNA-binding protein containing a PIN domain n=1 Tax=Sporosarcina pasteurii TaxID=1474 RepID=A0A380CJ12_SPOPA|nr:NYN domain-containing protein [Sporosarcina pasteurii]MDS9471985.1 NYN domain-containing protein [Sporosarcina pasteurii]QBQ06715.1 hypothetical protein E2C16_14155 [Sporosarcina pasteurii]SUJ21475.1 Predicted RNA-binding protein containing a PIN domain [Sporosarcina pasteurii]
MKKQNVLIVDGYNIIGAWAELRQLKDRQLEEARDLLIERMAEYKAYTGWRVIVVFDAYLMRGIESKIKKHDVEVLFTRENETADERIEKLVLELLHRRIQIHVATSDFTEQWIIFAQGALRKSARELEIEMKKILTSISGKVKDFENQQPTSKIPLSREVKEIFEKWRRGIR